MNSNDGLLQFIQDLQRLQAPPRALRSADRAAEAMSLAAEELDRRKARIEELATALESIQEIAENNYDGPEDKTLGAILVECQRALGQMP